MTKSVTISNLRKLSDASLYVRDTIRQKVYLQDVSSRIAHEVGVIITREAYHLPCSSACGRAQIFTVWSLEPVAKLDVPQLTDQIIRACALVTTCIRLKGAVQSAIQNPSDQV